MSQKLKKQLKANNSSREPSKQSRPHLKSLLHFWPGDWKQRWRKLKTAFERENAACVKPAGERAKKLRPPSQNEF
jgi:hypothetical protein